MQEWIRVLRRRSWRQWTVALALFTGGWCGTAYGQDADATDEAPVAAPVEMPDDEVEEIIVTGTRIKRSGTFPSSAPVQVLDAKELARSGAKTVGDLLQNLTAAPGSGVMGMGGGSAEGRFGTAGANLRGLGFGATLVLLNGRRYVKSAAGAAGGDFSDLSIIPIGAVRRVEVLKGGASAVYGADAVAGVVNVITYSPSDWAGLKVFVNADSDDEGDYRGYNVGFTFGAHDERGGVILSADFDLHTELLANQRDWTLGGQHIVPQSFPANYLVGTQNIPDPNCTAGANSLIVDRDGTSLCAFSDRDFLPLLPAMQRGNIFASAEYKLTEHATAFAETVVSRMVGDSVAWPFMVLPAYSITVPADHVDNPFGQDVLFSGRVAEQAHGRIGYNNTTFSAVVGLRGDFGSVAEYTMFDDWEWEVFSTYGVSRVISRVPENLRYDLQDAVNSCSDLSDLSGCYNPFYSSVLGTGTPNSADVMAQIQGEHSTTRDSGMRTQNVSVTGTLFELPGGPIGVALGGQLREEWAASDSGHDAETYRLGLVIGSSDYKVSRKVYAGFLELRLPVIDGIEIQGAGRLERHTDINQTSINPTVGVTMSPYRIIGEGYAPELLRRMTLRGHIAKAFRAPSMDQSAAIQRVIPTQINVDNSLPLWLPVQIAGNPKVKNESAVAWSAGIDWTLIDEITLLGEFWSFSYKDRIEAEDPAGKVQDWLASNAAMGGCNTSHPNVDVDTTAGCNPTRVSVQTFNADGTVSTSGIDFGLMLKLTGETFGGSKNDFGTISLGAQGVYTLSYKIPRSAVSVAAIESGDIECDGEDDAGACEVVGNRNATNFAPPLPKVRVNFPLGWYFGGHAATVNVRYIGAVEDDKDTSVNIDSMTTVDFQYGFTVEDWIGRSVGLRVGVLNLFDQDPPLVASDQLAYDPAIHDPRGRMFYAKLTSEF